MFSALRHRTAALALGVCFILPVHASSPKPGDFANTQARHIATFFPGRMTGTPAEMLSADYIRQQFQQMGYRSDIRTFNSRYIYTARDNRKSWHNVTGSTVIAAHEGKAPQQIIIMAHLARSHGIAATTNPGLNKNYPKGTGCCNDAEIFDKAGIAVLSVEATNWNLGNKDGYQQRAKTAAFPAGNSWHDVRLDNQQHIDKALPGRIERRCRDVMRIMLPLVKELAKAS
ncbi:hypothetical protein ACENH9_002527 [Shigella sonnei]